MPNESWPDWERVSDEDMISILRLIAKYALFLKPEIVKAIVIDNEKNRAEWIIELKNRNIDPSLYL
jgi:hypothetical protein